MGDDTIKIRKADLHALARAMFVAAGVKPDWAEDWARVLVWANLRGVDSHGVIRIPRYLDLIAKKSINLQPDIRVDRRAGALAVIEADLAPGPVVMMQAADEAIARARETHVGWCTLRNMTHAGAIGYYALRVAEAGMASVVVGASGPMMMSRTIECTPSAPMTASAVACVPSANDRVTRSPA